MDEKVRLAITARRVRIDPESKRREYIHRLERLMEQLDEVLSDPESVGEIQLKAMGIIIKAISACYAMVRDIDVENLESEVEEIKGLLAKRAHAGRSVA